MLRDGETVEALENGRPLEVEQVNDEDPLYLLNLHLPDFLESGKHSRGKVGNLHMFRAKAQSARTPVTVRVRNAAGEIVRNELRKNGVDTSLAVSSPETPVTTMFVRADGTRRSVTNQAHRYNFHPEKEPGRFTDAKALILGSLFRAPFDDPEVIHSVVSSAKAAGQLVVADTKLPNFRFLALKDIGDSLPLIDIITPNEDEARYFTGKDDPEEMADVFLGCGVRRVLIKLGSKGCLMKDDTHVLRLPAVPIDPVDATGAGDNFVAGYVAETLRGASAEDALRFANACGAICTTAAGAGTALKDREQVLQLL